MEAKFGDVTPYLFFFSVSCLTYLLIDEIIFVTPNELICCISFYIKLFLIFFTDCPLPPSLPRRCTLKFLFTSYLTLQAPPKRYFFELLSHFTTSEMEEERLKEFCSAEGQVCEFMLHLHFSDSITF